MGELQHDSPVQFVKGVGPRRAEALAELGVHTVHDLLHYFPYRHELDCGQVAIEDITPGATVTIQGEIARVSGRPPGLRCDVYDGTGTCKLRWFQRRAGGQGMHVGALVRATGKVQLYNDAPELIQPRVLVLQSENNPDTSGRGERLRGVYPANKHITSATIRNAVETLFSHAALPVPDCLPPRLRRKRNLVKRGSALRGMHTPKDQQHLQQARQRLAYEELFLMELAMALRRQKRLQVQQGQRLPISELMDTRIRARFPFKLTPAQDKVIQQIATDLASGQPMTRLVQGDVGSGKTVVALYACLAAIAHRRQAAIMAPTELLAQQHYHNIQQYLADSRVRTCLLTGGQRASEQRSLHTAIAAGDVDLVVGTHALIQKHIAFDRLALVVVDEQHKFGVVQRHQFRTKGPLPHYLVMTATPIPRTLAMTVFGDLDVSVIDQPPPGRGKTETRIVRPAQWNTIMRYVRGRLAGGERAYVVCPQIGSSDETPSQQTDPPAAAPGRPIASVHQVRERLSRGPWRGLNLALLHGGMSAPEKRAAIAAFTAGQLHALVSTTVVEVGIDVPDATIMLIEHADRYGLSQLHQLRGRIGRGTRNSLCVLICRSRSDKAAQRLDVLARTTDGFEIAEADLRQRGPGELFGTRQHGLPELRIASLVDDFGLLQQARGDAFDLVRQDPDLQHREHAQLWPALQQVFGQKLALIDAG